MARQLNNNTLGDGRDTETVFPNSSVLGDFGERIQFSYADFLQRMSMTVEMIDFSEIGDMFSAMFVRIPEEQAELVLHLTSFLYRLYRSLSMTDVFVTALDFLRGVFGIRGVLEGTREMYLFVKGAVNKWRNQMLLTIRGESNLVDKLRDIRTNLQIVLSSDIVQTMRDFVLTLVSFKVFGKEKAITICSHLGPAKPTTTFGFVELCLTTLISILSFRDNFEKGGSVSQIFTSKDPVGAFIARTDELEAQKELTYCGLPVAGRVCRREYVTQVSRIIKDGERLLKELPKAAPARKSVESNVRKMRLVHAAFMNIMSAETRSVPFVVALVGSPGIGKGLLLDVICMIWSMIKGRDYNSAHVYHRLANSDFWAGYEPYSQPYIHYSEPGNLHRKIAGSQGDATISEFLSVSDNQPFMCNMADVESKGKVYAIPELITMDTNDAAMNFDVTLNNPSAARRRILYVVPVVKEEFRKTGTCQIDQSKSLSSDVPMLDRWEFTVYEMPAINPKESDMLTHLTGANIYEFVSFLKIKFTDHMKEQEGRVGILRNVRIEEYLPENRVDIGPLFDVQAQSLVTAEFASVFLLIGFMWQYLRDFFFSIVTRDQWITMRKILEHSMCLAWYMGAVIFWHFLLFMTWMRPSFFVFQFIALRSIYGKIDYYLDRCHFHYVVLKLCCGIDAVYILPPPPERPYHYIGACVVALTALRALKTVSVFAQGNVISSSKERSEEEVDFQLQKHEQESKCEMPPPRKKAGNTIDWENIDKPIPSLITHENQKKKPEEIANTILRNMRCVKVRGKRTIDTQIIGVCEDLAIINRHSLYEPRDNKTWDIEACIEAKVGVICCTVLESEMVQMVGDLWLIRLRGLKFHDIRKYVPSDYVSYKYGLRGQIRRDPIVCYDSYPISPRDSLGQEFHVSHAVSYEWNNHADGQCGSPVLSQFSGVGYGLVAIHVGAVVGTKSAFGQKIHSGLITEAVEQLHKKSVLIPVNSQGKLRLPVGITGIGKLDHRSPLRFEEVPGLNVYGGLEGYTPGKLGKSTLRSSEFIRVAEELTGVSPFKDGVPLFAPPPFSHGYNDKGEYVAPYNHFVKKCGVKKKSLNPKIMKKTVSMLTKRILSALKGKGITKINPVPLSVAQNGHPEDFYMRAMKSSTSGGWMWHGTKRKYSSPCEFDFKKDSLMPIYDVKEQVLEQLEAYKRDEDAVPLLGAQLKDEPRSWKKVKERKTRVFCMSPYESTLVNRMYLMPLYTLLVEHSDIFCTAIGINMHSTDVDKLVKRMTAMFKKFMEGDYEGYDTSMPYDVGLMVNTLLYNIAKALGYDESALQALKGILSDNMNPTVVMRGDVFSSPALQPSGKYGTAEDNSLRGLVMLCYAFIAVCTEMGVEDRTALTTRFVPEDFFDHILPLLYGDDSVSGLSDEVAPYFNNIIYQKFCREVYGLGFTNAQKTDTMAPWLEFKDVSFLKRNFVYREDLGVYVAPIELSSIMKTICYYLPSREVTKEEQLISSCVSAQRELFFHLHEDEFMARRERFIHYCCEYFSRRDDVIRKSFPSFQEIKSSLYPSEIVAQSSVCSDDSLPDLIPYDSIRSFWSSSYSIDQLEVDNNMYDGIASLFECKTLTWWQSLRLGMKKRRKRIDDMIVTIKEQIKNPTHIVTPKSAEICQFPTMLIGQEISLPLHAKLGADWVNFSERHKHGIALGIQLTLNTVGHYYFPKPFQFLCDVQLASAINTLLLWGSRQVDDVYAPIGVLSIFGPYVEEILKHRSPWHRNYFAFNEFFHKPLCLEAVAPLLMHLFLYTGNFQVDVAIHIVWNSIMFAKESYRLYSEGYDVYNGWKICMDNLYNLPIIPN